MKRKAIRRRIDGHYERAQENLEGRGQAGRIKDTNDVVFNEPA
jgi:hypothetical protein